MPFTSCKSDERDSEKIVGTWTCVSDSRHHWGQHCDLNGRNGEEHQIPFDDYDEDLYKGEIVTFKEDGTFTSSASYSLLLVSYGGTWAIIDNQLFIDGSYVVWDIEQLSNSKLKLMKTKSGSPTPYDCRLHWEDYTEYKREFKKL